MRISSFLMFLGLALPYVGRADQPAEPTSAAVTAPVPSSSTANDPPAAEKTPAQLKMEEAEAKIRKNGVNGYKPEKTKSGEVLYCKTETPIGTHFEQKQCRTYEQLRDEALRGKDFLEQMQRAVPPAKG